MNYLAEGAARIRLRRKWETCRAFGGFLPGKARHASWRNRALPLGRAVDAHTTVQPLF